MIRLAIILCIIAGSAWGQECVTKGSTITCGTVLNLCGRADEPPCPGAMHAVQMPPYLPEYSRDDLKRAYGCGLYDGQVEAAKQIPELIMRPIEGKPECKDIEGAIK